jgi:hypothetical protein
MKKLSTCIAILGLTAFATLAAQAQFYKIHNADVSVGASSPFDTTLVQNAPGNQGITETTGFLFSFKEHPVSWAGIEVNYGYDKYSEHFYYTNPNGTGGFVRTGTDMHEATGAYIFHPHFKHLQPFMTLGGGAIDFEPVNGRGFHQWRGTGLVEAGLDIPTSNPHFGFRIQGRDLIYRAPNFGTPVISTKSWISTAEPALSVWVRF